MMVPAPVSTSRCRRVCRIALSALALLASACNPGGDSPGNGGQPVAGMPGGIAPVTVVTARVSPQDFTDRFTALGTARANESIEVTSRSSGIITGINFREGQRVRRGDLLVELDARQERAAISLEEAELKQAESVFRRSETLARTKAVSDADLEQLAAQVAIRKAQLSGAKARLDQLFIRAPFAGTIGLRRVSLGDLVGPETVITTLDDTATIRLEFALPELFIADLRTGLEIEAQSAVYPARRFRGKVVSVDSRVDPVTRAVTVIAEVPNSDRALKPGMFLTVALEKTREDVLLVPEEALVPREGKQFVYLVKDGRAIEREVTLGGRVPGLAEVRSGLEADATVITEGTQRVRDGAPVLATPAT